MVAPNRVLRSHHLHSSINTLLCLLCLPLQVFAIIAGYFLLGETFAPTNLGGTGLAVFVTFLFVLSQYVYKRKSYMRVAAAENDEMANGEDGADSNGGPEETRIDMEVRLKPSKLSHA